MKGVLLQLPAVFIAAMIAVIILFSVVLPIVNTGIVSSASNLSGNSYGGALQVAVQLPLILILTLFVAVAVVIIRSFSM